MPRFVKESLVRESFCQRKFRFVEDTGGPLMVYSNATSQYELVGITSARNGCIAEGIYTRVEPFIEWLANTMANPPPTVPPFVFPTIPTVTQVTPKPDVLGETESVYR